MFKSQASSSAFWFITNQSELSFHRFAVKVDVKYSEDAVQNSVENVSVRLAITQIRFSQN